MQARKQQGAPLCERAAGEFWAAEMSRRQFLRAGLTLVAVGLAAPPWLAHIAHADAQRLRKGEQLPNDHILVVLQLTGGNDGLNTIVPYRDELYYRARPMLAIPESQVIPLDERLGLHPALEPLKALYDQRALAILQNVGYPNPNRSHFRSMEIWQTADPDGYSRYGWLGKYLDTLTDAAANPVMAISFTQELPLALHSKRGASAVLCEPCRPADDDARPRTGAHPQEPRRSGRAQDGQPRDCCAPVDAHRAAGDGVPARARAQLPNRRRSTATTRSPAGCSRRRR
jgi:uncharacterized protein (DUF1501 family)